MNAHTEIEYHVYSNSLQGRIPNKNSHYIFMRGHIKKQNRQELKTIECAQDYTTETEINMLTQPGD